jgi:hypothetical protein
MTDLALEHLKRIQADISDIKTDVRDLKAEAISTRILMGNCSAPQRGVTVILKASSDALNVSRRASIFTAHTDLSMVVPWLSRWQPRNRAVAATATRAIGKGHTRMTLTTSIKDLVQSRVARDPDFAAARRLRLSVGFGKYGSTSRDRLFGSMVAANGAGAPLRGSTKMPRGP